MEGSKLLGINKLEHKLHLKELYDFTRKTISQWDIRLFAILCILITGFNTSVENPKKIGKGSSKDKNAVQRNDLNENQKKKISEAGDKPARVPSRKSMRSDVSSRKSRLSQSVDKTSRAASRKSVKSAGSSKKSPSSIYATQQPLYDTRKTFEVSESEPIVTENTTTLSSDSEEIINRESPGDKKLKEQKDCEKENDEKDNKETESSNRIDFEDCKECNGKEVNEALSQENVRLIRNIQSREKKLRDTKRQLHEERAFYEQQKMELCKSVSKKKSKSQIVQTDNSPFQDNKVCELESRVKELQSQLEKGISKYTQLKEKCVNLKKQNSELKSEINVNEEDYEKSWKEVHEKLEKYKKEYGSAEKNFGNIKIVYDEVLKKNACLAKSNFALQAELRRLYRKFEKLECSIPSPLKLENTKAKEQSASSPELWTKNKMEVGKKRKKRRSKTLRHISTCESEDNKGSLIVSGSLISVHQVDGSETRLRPVFLVLDEARKKGSHKTRFGSFEKPKSESTMKTKNNNKGEVKKSPMKKEECEKAVKTQEVTSDVTNMVEKANEEKTNEEKTDKSLETAESQEITKNETDVVPNFVERQMKDIKETKNSDTENCIIECKVHSSSVQ